MKLVAFDDVNGLWSMYVDNYQKQRRLTFRENALQDNLHTIILHQINSKYVSILEKTYSLK